MLSPSGPAAAFYATEAEAAVAGETLTAQVAARIEGGRRKRGQAPVVRDGRLDRVALDIVRVTAGRRAPDPEAVAFLLWHYGVVEPEPSLFLLRGDNGAEATALADLESQLAVASASSDWRRAGIGVERTPGQWSMAIVFQEKSLDLNPVPRVHGVGAHATIAGRIQGTVRAPEVLVTPPQGAVKRPATKVRREAFSAELACGPDAGVYQVEINAQDERGPRVLANFPVYCGVAPPLTFALAVAAATTMDAALVERHLLELLDRDRRAHGLPLLQRDARLAAVARRYSQEMADHGEVAHISPRTGSAVDRVRKAGIAPPPTVLAENVGSAASAGDAERAFMGSPAHRDNILNRDVTHVGVGVAIGRDEGGTVPLYFTQIFAGWDK
ncbi:MAG: CAP domain-containing protein [Deltaproteobacteria bacterium]|nr:CAP domain-containing protein [Deltaproteobacteria bacterium]